MTYDESLARRIREEMYDLPGFIERKMFGGVGFMLDGNMACGVNGQDLIVRVGPEAYESALEAEYTRPFDLTGRPMTGWVVVAPQGCADDDALTSWVEQGIEYAQSLPPK